MMNTEHVQRQPRLVLIIHRQEPLVEFLKLGLRYEGFHVEANDHPVWACHPHSSISLSLRRAAKRAGLSASSLNTSYFWCSCKK